MGKHFSTVGELRPLLEGLPADRHIACQIVGEDGTAWNVWGSFTPQVPQGTIACMTFSHPELKTLNNVNPDDAPADLLLLQRKQVTTQMYYQILREFSDMGKRHIGEIIKDVPEMMDLRAKIDWFEKLFGEYIIKP